MEIEKITTFTSINPVIQKQLYAQYKQWADYKVKHNAPGPEMRKCTNCKKYFPEEETTVIHFASGQTTRRCSLCAKTINSYNRIRRR